MDEYIRQVHRAAEEATGKDMIHNRSPRHAAIIVTELFGKATQSVKVLCQGLNDAVYGDPRVTQSAINFLNAHPNATLEIVVESDVSANANAFLRRLKTSDLLHRVVVRRLPDQLQNVYEYNFMLADDVHYRYEPDRSACEAVALFGNVDDGKYLLAAFTSLQEVSPKVNL